ncbi:hypothetical protein C922_02654 [Plasmodium inui San Antonio 1]|uniref:Nucleoside transporter 2 n=1 Tax=Plasmodium inui San Antonio 1 TaxID=1237626 RepID=W7A5P7_9APIC|nr:hypothetical protein C922_02654 [Plasmodium inui San Antonio 1]EUD67070.1 hypothetical protein C922_02654 [Plasmodium inui San Antonio 1]
MNTPSKRTNSTGGPPAQPVGEDNSERKNIAEAKNDAQANIRADTRERSTPPHKEHRQSGNTFANITLCLMGMSSVLLYNCVLNTTPHIHELLNRNIVVSSTFFLYFSVLVSISLISSLFIEVKTRTYDICFVISFILQLLYPLVVKYYYDRTFLFYLLIGFIGATCSMMKTMIFSIATIVVNSSKVICLSYGLTGIYSLFITSTFFYFLIKIDKDVHKLMHSIFATCLINCTFIFVSFVCYSLLKRNDEFKRKFKIYQEEREGKRSRSGRGTLFDTAGGTTGGASFVISVEGSTREGRYSGSEGDEDKQPGKGAEKKASADAKDTKDRMDEMNPMEVTPKSRFFQNISSYNVKLNEMMKQARIKAFLYKKSIVFLFCTFYNIFLKIAVFPVVCPEMWTKNVDERYILIGMVQLADCVSRIFPTFAETVPAFKMFLLPQRKVFIYSLARTFLSVLCLIIPLTDAALLQNFVFKCLLIFSNIYLNGWFVVLSFINISDVLKPLNSMSNVAMVSSFGSSLLRVGLLTGYAASIIYKRYVAGGCSGNAIKL